MDTPLSTETAELVWEPCGSCWGQRVIWHRDPHTGGMHSETCEGCVGVGQRAVFARAVRGVPTRR